MEKNSGQKGQVLLIVLLVMVVGLTIGLSLATRSVTDIKISTQLEESSRAFAAAEAGIEAALKGEAAPASPVLIGNATYTFSTTTAGGTDQPLVLGEVGIADTYTVWLYPHDVDGNLPSTFSTTADYGGASIDICWRKTGESVEPAMEITLIYYDPSAPLDSRYKAQRGAYDPALASRSPPNNFSPTTAMDCGLSQAGFSYGTTFNLPTPVNNFALIALRLRPFYAEANVGIAPQSGQNLPSQGLLIASTGTAGETTRKVEVVDSYPSLPAIFDYVLFSGTNVTHE